MERELIFAGVASLSKLLEESKCEKSVHANNACNRQINSRDNSHTKGNLQVVPNRLNLKRKQLLD